MPIFKEERYQSIPLAGGHAEPYNKSGQPTINIVHHVDGQYLVGDMVPKRENSQAEEAKKKKEVSLGKKDDLLGGPSKIAGELTPLLEGDENGYSSN